MSEQATFENVISHKAVPDAWIATLAHELRNPLSAVVMALDELRPWCAGMPAATPAWEVAVRGSRQMARVIEDVLELCRVPREGPPARFEPVDVSAVVAGAVAAVRPTIAVRQQCLSVSVPRGLARLCAHESRLEQVLTNLLINAAKFTDPFGQISLTVESATDRLVIRVRDNGIGISPDLLPHVFDAYVRGPVPNVAPRPGLGIGLTLVQSLVRLMGGSVSAHSDGVGAGAEFVVTLPKLPAE